MGFLGRGEDPRSPPPLCINPYIYIIGGSVVLFAMGTNRVAICYGCQNCISVVSTVWQPQLIFNLATMALFSLNVILTHLYHNIIVYDKIIVAMGSSPQSNINNIDSQTHGQKKPRRLCVIIIV